MSDTCCTHSTQKAETKGQTLCPWFVFLTFMPWNQLISTLETGSQPDHTLNYHRSVTGLQVHAELLSDYKSPVQSFLHFTIHQTTSIFTT